MVHWNQSLSNTRWFSGNRPPSRGWHSGECIIRLGANKIRITVVQVRSVVDSLNEFPHSANKKSKPDRYDRQNNDCHNAYYELVGP